MDLELNGVQDSGGVAQEEELGVVALRDEGGGAPGGPLDLDDVVAGEPGEDVELVDGRVGDGGRGVLARVGLDVAVHGVGHEERPVGPGGEAVAQGEVAGIEAAHEADRHERRGQGVMGAHHLDGLSRGGGERLLA